jgi:hypothetical protein
VTQSVIFAPLVGWPVLWALAALAVALVALALWRGLPGWWLRALGLGALVLALANPALQDEERTTLSDIVILVVDESASQTLGDRAAQTAAAVAAVEAEVAALPNTELRIHRVGDGDEGAGTLAMTVLAEALAEEPRARVAGAIVITDGQVHDPGLVPNLTAPLQVLLTGRKDDWDRRLVVQNAPAFAIIGEEFILALRVEDIGAAPREAEVDLTIAVDTEEPATYTVPLNADLELPVTLPHGGANVLQFSVAPVEGELTDRNNATAIQINGVRDRLRVLLVSGEPHAGERVWRNLLKSDAAVDLVHFTILRPPEKQDGVPVDELSLIAFPTRELFVEKIEEFDLIIFDRYRMRGILPMSYIENVVNYVRGGGTVLVAAGPEYGAVDSLYRSPLAQILPVAPTAQVVEEGFRPALTDLGRRHPVTEGLEAAAPEGGWGRWFRAIEVEHLEGQILMTGPRDLPLLVLNRVDQGRVAVLASDHAWLWGRGYEGGGPQLELLRRLAHWMLKEPELEEETLTASVHDQTLTVTRRTLQEDPPGPLTITGPDGTEVELDLPELSPGRFETTWEAPMLGLYRLEQDDLTRVIAVGPAAPREFVETIASGEVLAPLAAATLGGVMRVEDGLPDIRTVADGRPAIGRGWIGITPREAYLTTDVNVHPFLPAWAWLLLAAGLAVAAWLIEGRRGARAA